MKIEEYLEKWAKETPQKEALIDTRRRLTYEETWNEVREKAKKHKGRKNKTITLRNTQDIDFLTEYFAIHISEAVAVPLGKDYPEEKFNKLTEELKNKTIPEGSADILYTTGTTGKEKGVIISHSTITADAENLIDGQGYKGYMTEIITGPLNHIGSLTKIYPMIVTGGTVRIMESMKDMNEFLRAIDEAEGMTATFMVPTQIRMMISMCGEELRKRGDKIEIIETGAAPISQKEMEDLCELLPKTRLYNTYASTETGIITTYDYNTEETIAGCLGRPMKNSTLRISDEGKIVCGGKTLMTGYIGDEEMTKTVLKNGEIHTNDIAEIDDKGRLRLKGREGDIINIGGYKIAPTEVEDTAKEIKWIKDCICVETEHKTLGKMLKLIVVTDKEELNKQEIAKHIGRKLERHKVPMIYEKAEKIERTYNGKLNRKFYKQ